MICRGLKAGAVALVCAQFAAGLTAQSVRLSMDGLRDQIPATHLTWTLEAASQPTQSLYLTAGGRHLRIDQAAFQGMPRFEETLQSAWAEAATLLGQRAAVTVRLGLNRDGEGATDGVYLVRGQFAVPLGGPSHPVVTTFTVEAARAREATVAAALAEGIVYDRLAGGLDLRLGARVSGAARVTRDSYSDDNRKLQGYAYGLVQLVSAPSVSVGYAWSFADSEVDNWRVTGSTMDPATQIHEYRYFYYPYFTPIEERGHAALAVFTWSAPGGATLAASANVPVASRGQLQSVPQWGMEPQPLSYGYYSATSVLPLQAGAGAWLPLLAGLSVGARYDWFSKSYYSYHAGGVSLRFTF
jgi:hypothetical protein